MQHQEKKLLFQGWEMEASDQAAVRRGAKPGIDVIIQIMDQDGDSSHGAGRLLHRGSVPLFHVF